MKHTKFSTLVLLMIAIPTFCLAQTDTTKAIKPMVKDSLSLSQPGVTDSVVAVKQVAIVDSVVINKTADSMVVISTPMNCYKQWLDVFAERGVKPITDGQHEVVIAFKSKESCHCYMGKVEVSGGKLKAPLLVQTEGGEYKTFLAMGKKLDPDFLAVQGDALWQITNGMSVLFQTVDQEYGRVFFYKTLNKNKQANKEAPSPADLLK